MENSDTKIESYRSLRLGYLPLLSLTVRHSQDSSAYQQSLELVVGTETEKTTLAFANVQGLRIQDLNAGSKCMLEITSLSGRQLENLRYQVMNLEQDLTLNFLCSDFSARKTTLG
jgi:hypothetical protein